MLRILTAGLSTVYAWCIHSSQIDLQYFHKNIYSSTSTWSFISIGGKFIIE